MATATNIATLERAEAALADLLEQMADELKERGAVDVAAWQGRYPEMASEIARLVPTLHTLVELSGDGSSNEPGDLHESMAQQTLGDFRIVRELGRGGMGIVYEAEQLSLSRRVALKVLPMAAVLDPRTLQRFKNEAQAAAAIEHPHIVAIYGVGCERGIHYYAMRLINGCTLADVIAQLRMQADRDPSKLPSSLAEVPSSAIADTRDSRASGNDEATEAAATQANAAQSTVASTPTRRPRLYNDAMLRSIAQLGIHVAEALAHAHEQGIIHRDIKPSNLMLDGQGKVWVTDFGLAHIEANQSVTVTGDLVGTLRYMSPEQALAKRVAVDHRSDLYSLGATLYELLTLQPVFAGADRATLLHRIAFADPVPPRRLNPRLPADLETILLKLLEKDAQHRYASAGELATDLARYINGQPIKARRPTGAQRVVKWLGRNRSLVRAVVATALIAIVLAGAAIGWLARDAAARRAAGERTAEESLALAGDLWRQRKWPQTQGQLERAEAALAGQASQSPLRTRVGTQLADVKMVRRLEELRLRGVTTAANGVEVAPAHAEYAAAFAAYGIPIDDLSVHEAVRQIELREIREELASGVAEWSAARALAKKPSGKDSQALLEIAQLADPWLKRFRGSDEVPAETLGRLDPGELSPRQAEWLIRSAARSRVATEAIGERFRSTQRLHPDDFWINFSLARYFQRCEPPRLDDAVRFFTSAAALRPDSAVVRNNLGVALQQQGRREEAIAEYRRAIQLDPQLAIPLGNLGAALYEAGKVQEAVVELERALRLRSDLPTVHHALGMALVRVGQTQRGINSIQHAINLSPEMPGLHGELGQALQSVGKSLEAIDAYHREISLRPSDAKTLNNLGAVWEAVGKRQEAFAAYEQALKIAPKYLLAQRNLATCLVRMGQYDEAFKPYERALDLSVGDPAAVARTQKLLGDAQRLAKLHAELPEIASGEKQPVGALEVIDFARLCRYGKRFTAAARYFRRAIEIDPALAPTYGYDAACTAALAAGSNAEGEGVVSEMQKSELREQAFRWISAELQLNAQRIRQGPAGVVPAVRALRTWQLDPDFASVRDPAQLALLETREADQWRRLWSTVQDVLREADAVD